MKTMKILGTGFVGAMSLALVGCGGGGGNNGQAAAPVPYNQYQQGQVYNQAITCQSGVIQLRNAFGQSQCFQTADLGTACAQVGGILTQGTLCRKERLISGTAKGKFRNNGSMAPDNIPLRMNLFPGEGVKVYGVISSLNATPVSWNAQIIQDGVAQGSSSGEAICNQTQTNLSITSMGNSTQQYNQQQYGQPYNNAQYTQPYNQYQQPYAQNYQQPYGQPYNQQYMPTTYPNQYGSTFNSGFYNQPTQATSSVLVLQLMFEGKIKVDLHASAISCEDGHGNSYPCQ